LPLTSLSWEGGGKRVKRGWKGKKENFCDALVHSGENGDHTLFHPKKRKRGGEEGGGRENLGEEGGRVRFLLQVGVGGGGGGEGEEERKEGPALSLIRL